MAGSVLLSTSMGGLGCSAEGNELFLSLRTDYLPDAEFTEVEVEIPSSADPPSRTSSGRVYRHLTYPGEDYLEGVRVAEVDGLPDGPLTLVVRLRRADGRQLDERRVLVMLDERLSSTVVITRSCGPVRCPGPDDPSEATECLAGGCVPPACLGGDAEACGAAAGCETDSDCTAPVDCLAPVCRQGVCFATPVDGACGPGEQCTWERGCEPVDLVPGDAAVPGDSGAVVDGGPEDAGVGDGGAVGDAPPCADVDLGSAVGDSVYSGSLSESFDDWSGSCGGSGSEMVLYWVAPETGRYRYLACASSGDLVLYARSTCRGGELACNDNLMNATCGLLSPGIHLDVTRGDSILLFVDSRFDSGATFDFHIEQVSD